MKSNKHRFYGHNDKWIVAYYHGDSETPLHYLGTPERPAIFTEPEAHDEAARLNAEIVNSAQEEAFDGDFQVWRYAAVPMPVECNIETTCD